jgi:hypothetical protein
MVFEARVADLVRLQAWLDDEAEKPLRDCLDSIDGLPLDGPQRDRLLFDALDACDGNPPTWFNEAGAARLSRGDGLLAFLAAALHRGNPGLSGAELAELAAALTAAEVERLRTAFYGVGLRRILEGFVFAPYPPAETRPAGKPVTWLEAVFDVVQTYGWTLEYALGLSLTQFRLARAGGKVDEGHGFAVRPDQQDAVRADLARRREAAYAAAGGEAP